MEPKKREKRKQSPEILNRIIINYRKERRDIANSKMIGFECEGEDEVSYYLMPIEANELAVQYKAAILDKLDRKIIKLDLEYKELVKDSLKDVKSDFEDEGDNKNSNGQQGNS